VTHHVAWWRIAVSFVFLVVAAVRLWLLIRKGR
jgi:hypothetical protein